MEVHLEFQRITVHEMATGRHGAGAVAESFCVIHKHKTERELIGSSV